MYSSGSSSRLGVSRRKGVRRTRDSSRRSGSVLRRNPKKNNKFKMKLDFAKGVFFIIFGVLIAEEILCYFCYRFNWRKEEMIVSHYY